MKKFWFIIVSVIVVALGAGQAFTDPDRPPRAERRPMDEVFALAGQGYRLGVILSEIGPHQRNDLKVDSGVVVEEVFSNSPAEKAGLKDGDIIVSIDGKNVESERDIRKMLRDLDAPKEMTLDVLRDGKSLKIQVTPEKRDLRMLARMGGNYIGIELQELDADLSKYFQTEPDAGMLVARVEPDSPAEKGGLKSGDVITEINGAKVTSQKDLRKALNDIKEGESASLTILRHGKSQKISVKPEQRSFHIPRMENLRELRDLDELGDLPEIRNLPELRDLPNRPEFRESMQELKREMEKLKEEVEELKKELREKD